ncbi:MAG: response regulator transcription factor [Ilumatobacteraceae bacterium]
MSLTVVLVDDHTMLRQSLRRALESEGVTVVGEAADGAAGVHVALATKPDVVLMDVSMPGTDGIDATRQLNAADNRMRVACSPCTSTAHIIDRAIKAGAVGYLTKDSSRTWWRLSASPPTWRPADYRRWLGHAARSSNEDESVISPARKKCCNSWPTALAPRRSPPSGLHISQKT